MRKREPIAGRHAIDRARKLPVDHNPSTNVWELVSALRERK